MSKNNILIGSKLGDGNILIGTKYGGFIPTTTTTTTSTTTTTAGPTTTTTTAPPPTVTNIAVSVTWGGSCSSFNEGYAGTFRLYGCDNFLHESCTVSAYACMTNVGWTGLSSCCYYFDFSGMVAYCFGVPVSCNYSWIDSYGSGSSVCTSCFSGDNNMGLNIIPL